MKDLVISGSLPTGLNLGFHLAFLIAATTALTTAREGYHHAVAIPSAVAVVAYFSLLFRELQ